ncbi:LacI family DNA-binding transcriptional regulator [Vibrio sp. E150_011]
MNKKRVTIGDIAKYIGVDKSTVSRALSGSSKVKKETVLKVQRACKDLKYVPNDAARALASSESKSLVLLVPSLSNEIFSDIVTGAKKVCTEKGYTLLIGDTGYSPMEEESLIKHYLQQNVAGFVLTENTHTDESVSLLDQFAKPVIEIMDCTKPPNFNQVIGINNDTATRDVIRYLVGKGRKNIAFCSCFLDDRASIRKTAMQSELKLAGLPFDKVLTMTGATSLKVGQRSIIEIVRKWPDVDAIMYINDDLASGASMEATRRGLEVGEQIDIFGFNDLEYASHFIPSLSSVRTPRMEMGELAFCNLIEILNGQGEMSPLIELKHELILRDSA